MALAQQQTEHWRATGVTDVFKAQGREQLTVAKETLRTRFEDVRAVHLIPSGGGDPVDEDEIKKHGKRIESLKKLEAAVDDVTRIAECSLRPLPPATGYFV